MKSYDFAYQFLLFPPPNPHLEGRKLPLSLQKEKTLEETVAIALKQIEEKQYATQLINRGISKKRIRSYGFAFEGKTVLIG